MLKSKYIIVSIREDVPNLPGIITTIFPTLQSAIDHVNVIEGAELFWTWDDTVGDEWQARHNGEIFIIKELVEEEFI